MLIKDHSRNKNQEIMSTSLFPTYSIYNYYKSIRLETYPSFINIVVHSTYCTLMDICLKITKTLKKFAENNFKHISFSSQSFLNQDLMTRNENVEKFSFDQRKLLKISTRGCSCIITPSTSHTPARLMQCSTNPLFSSQWSIWKWHISCTIYCNMSWRYEYFHGWTFFINKCKFFS